MRIKAISRWQPWASLMSLGYKRFETHSWKPPASLLRPGDLLGIHAAKSREGMHACCREPICDYLEAAGYRPMVRERRHGRDVCLTDLGYQLPVGAVLCIVRYEGACPTTHIESCPAWRDEERPLGAAPRGDVHGWQRAMLPVDGLHGFVGGVFDLGDELFRHHGAGVGLHGGIHMGDDVAGELGPLADGQALPGGALGRGLVHGSHSSGGSQGAHS